MVREDSNEGRTEKHERNPGLRPAILGSTKARPRAASADITLASSRIHGAEYVQQANVRGHITKFSLLPLRFSRCFRVSLGASGFLSVFSVFSRCSRFFLGVLGFL